jgi:hypothetical protein
MQRFTTPTLDLNDFADGGGPILAGYPTYAEAQQAIDRLAARLVPGPRTARSSVATCASSSASQGV